MNKVCTKLHFPSIYHGLILVNVILICFLQNVAATPEINDIEAILSLDDSIISTNETTSKGKVEFIQAQNCRISKCKTFFLSIWTLNCRRILDQFI